MKIEPGPDDRGSRLDVFLTNHLSDLTRSHIQSLNRCGAVLVNGRAEKAGYKIRGEESVEVQLDALPADAMEPRAMSLHIYYEDEDLAVIAKPAGLTVHPGAGTRSETLVHGLLHHFRSLSGVGGGTRPGIVHRLDKWTSGLLVVAKNDRAHVALSRAFQNRQVEKLYVALVHGRMKTPAANIDFNIGRHSTLRTRMATRPSGGRVAHTSYRVIEECAAFSLLEVKIQTGRTHQIRVHLSAIGHPVVGDGIYGERSYGEFVKKYGTPGRYFLHAASLKFMHPTTGGALEFQSPLPVDLQTLLERVRR